MTIYEGKEPHTGFPYLEGSNLICVMADCVNFLNSNDVLFTCRPSLASSPRRRNLTRSRAYSQRTVLLAIKQAMIEERFES